MLSGWRREICSMGETELKVNIVVDTLTHTRSLPDDNGK